MTSTSPSDIKHVPAPWTLKGTIYTLAIYISPSSALELSSHRFFLYSPLERHSPFAKDKPVGGLVMIQVIRYTESPVGPYDELVIIPGKFEHEKGSNLRVTRIYVSQEKTCWNGRVSEFSFPFYLIFLSKIISLVHLNSSTVLMTKKLTQDLQIGISPNTSQASSSPLYQIILSK